MIQIDLEIPKCCDECKFVYDSCACIITGTRIDWEKSDSERLLDCPLNKIAEPKTGHWIKNPYGFKCSKCFIVHAHTSIFCPSCGAKMIEPQESEVNNG